MRRALSVGVSIVVAATGISFGVVRARVPHGPARGEPPAQTAPARATLIDPAVQRENARPGSVLWRIAADAPRDVEGYGSATSVAAGERLDVYARTNAPTLRALVFRMGWYHGAGARLVAQLPPVRGDAQRACLTVEPRHTVTCSWRRTMSVRTGSTWPSGVYLLKLLTSRDDEAYVPFVVREVTTRAPIVVQASVTTWQAYNTWGGRSAYGGPCIRRIYPAPATSATPSPAATPVATPSPTQTAIDSPPPIDPSPAVAAAGAPEPVEIQEGTGCKETRSRAVSFDRPYVWPGAGQFLRLELPLVRWMEERGFGVAYTTDIDLRPGALAGRRIFISSGHDEYYSDQMRTALEGALAAGTSLAFFGGNDLYRRIRFEDGDRTMVNYKVVGEDPMSRTDLKATTGQWREWPIGLPEQVLLGAQYACNPAKASWVATGEPAWLFRGTGFVAGDAVEHLVGYEYDRHFDDIPPQVHLVARSPLRCGGKDREQNSTFYVAPSGAAVFDAGTVWWNCALGPGCSFRKPDERVRALVENLLRAMDSRRFG